MASESAPRPAPRLARIAGSRCTTAPADGRGADCSFIGILVHAFAAALIALLTYQIWRSTAAALLAGALFGSFPPELTRVVMGDSEPAFFLFAASGLLVWLQARNCWVQAVGALLSGVAVLARSNYLILPFTVGVGILLLDRGLFRYWRRLAVLSVVFLLPVFLWVARNYMVSGEFPLVSAVEGTTFYGGNNVIVATELNSWGSWIWPSDIKGEQSVDEVARTRTEAQTNSYYKNKALTFIREHWRSYPRLILGKLVRGFVPVPWLTPAPLVDLALAGIRGILYVAFLGFVIRGGVVTRACGIYLVGLFLVTLVTIVIFYGMIRFTLCLDAFLLPCVSAGIVREFTCYLQRRSGTASSASQATK